MPSVELQDELVWVLQPRQYARTYDSRISWWKLGTA